MLLIKFELYKLIRNKFLIISIILLLIFNVWITTKDISGQMIVDNKILNNFITDYNENKDDVEKYINDYNIAYQETMQLRRETGNNSLPLPDNKYVVYDNSSYKNDHAFFEKIYTEITNYSTNYNSTIKNAIKTAKSRILEYEYKMSKNPELNYNFEIEYQNGVISSYEKLIDIELEPTPISGYNYLLFQNGFGLISMIAILICGMFIIIPEKQSGFYPILRVSKNGRGKTFISKIITAFIVCFIICLLVTLTSTVAIGLLTGYSGGSALIQNLSSPYPGSVETYKLCPFVISINECVILSFVLRFLSCFTLLSIIILLTSIFSNYIPSFILGIIFVGANYIIGNYNFLNEYDPLKNLNFFWSINGVKPLIAFRALKIFKSAIPQLNAVIIVYSILIVITCIISLLLFIKGKGIAFNKLNSFFKKLQNKRGNNSNKIDIRPPKKLLSFELKKIFNPFMIIVIVISLMAVGILSYNNLNKKLTSQEIIYSNIIARYEGEWTEEKHNNIKETLDKYYQIQSNFDNIMHEYYEGTISREEFAEIVNLYTLAQNETKELSNIYNQSLKLQKLSESGAKAYFINEIGWTRYHNNNYSFVFIIAIILVLSNIFSIEYENKFDKILNSTISKERVILKKIIITIVFTASFLICFELIQLIIAMTTNELYYSIAPAINLSILNTDSQLPIVVIYILKFLKQLLFSFIFVSLILILSKTTKRLISTLLICSFVAFVPSLFTYFGFEFMNNISLVRLLGRS